jgi:hypothetical protein
VLFELGIPPDWIRAETERDENREILALPVAQDEKVC